MDTNRVPTRRLRIFLRDFRMVEAQVSLSEGQSLTTYFANRKTYLNLLGTHWASTQEDHEHAVLRVAQILWVSAPDGDVGLTNASGQPHQRPVEFQLDAGLLVRAQVLTGERQRLSDFLESAGQFIPMREAVLLRSGRPPRQVNVNLGDIVLNQEALQAAWEVETAGSAAELQDTLPGAGTDA